MSVKRYFWVDLLRVFMAIQVCLFHATVNPITKCEFGYFTPFIKMGAIAMTGFFMVSGYCLYKKYSGVEMYEWTDIKAFYKRRFISIIPLYWAVIILYKIFVDSSPIEHKIIIIPLEFLGLQSVFSGLFSFSHVSGTWFISCMILCYLSYPLLQQVVVSLKRKYVLLISILIVIALIYAPVVCHFFETESIYSNPIFRIMEFCIGIMIARLQDSYGKKLVKMGISFRIILIIMAFVLYVNVIIAMYNLGIAKGNYMFYSVAEIPFIALYLILLGDLNDGSKFWEKIIFNIARYTYGFYLANLISGSFLVNYFAMNTISNLSRVAIIIGVDLMVAIILHYLIEKPCTKWLITYIKST